MKREYFNRADYMLRAGKKMEVKKTKHSIKNKLNTAFLASQKNSRWSSPPKKKGELE